MKQYLWVGVAALFMSAHASENPFDLKQNFSKIDQDEEVLLVELRRLGQIKALAEEEALRKAAEMEAKNPKEEEITADSVQKMVESLTEVVDEETVVSEKSVVVEAKKETPNSVLDLVGPLIGDENSVMKESADASAKKEIKKKVAMEKEVLKKKEEHAKQLKLKEAALLKEKDEARKILEAKKEAERLEVIAYEKKRTEDLVKKKLADTAAKEKALVEKKEVEKEKVKKTVPKKETNMALSKAADKT